ncbi:XF1762 family protein [Streptomyces bluensis]|uniref:XF1762 family protein n=1 Tax=Streptomyces bluensis TaxID=33897 RepID=A0ABW6UU12_9ACTN
MQLRLEPVRFRDAAAFVQMWHRYNQKATGCKFCIGVADDSNVLRGVAIVGRPSARMLDNGHTLEVTRTATDGTWNVNSMLYAAAWNAAKALGYRRLVTYNHARMYGPLCPGPCLHESCRWIRVGESGVSLKAAGWRIVAQRPARAGWSCPSRPRDLNGSEGIPKTLWEAAS